MSAPAPFDTALPSLELPAIAELASVPRWVCWALARRGDQVTKVPLQPSGRAASSTDPRTWSSFSDCYGACVGSSKFSGIGVVLDGSDDLIAVDLDRVILSDGTLAPEARVIVKQINSYWELSPSGRGLRGFVRGQLPGSRCRSGPIEVYTRARFVTVTGRHLRGSTETIECRPREVESLYRQVFGEDDGRANGVDYERHSHDGELPERVKLLANEQRVRDLLVLDHDALGHPSESECDMAAASVLAHRGLRGDEIEAALRWRRQRVGGKRKADSYYNATVGRALAGVRGRVQR